MQILMLRQFVIYSLILTLGVTTVACGGAPTAQNPAPETTTAANKSTVPSDRLADGQYSVQQATYDDVDGEYSLMLLDTKPGESAVFRTTNLQMARLTDDEVKAGKKSYLKVEGGKPALYLTEDFKIEYVHNVTETRQNTQTGQPETVVVRQESNFWTPFAGALAGQAIGSLLFRPQYYVPPVYSPGRALTGYGGYGNSYDRAVSSYQSRYKAPPIAAKNQQLRTTGQLKAPTKQRFGSGSTNNNSNRSTGSGFGSTNLNRNPGSGSTYNRPSSGSRPRSGGFGSFRRRR